MIKAPRQPQIPPRVMDTPCPCGLIHRFVLGHYDVGAAKCGRQYWALQPERDGALKLFPWPGENLTRQEMADREATP